MGKRIFLTALLAMTTVLCGGFAWVEHRGRQSQEAASGFERRQLALAESENERLRGLVATYEKEKSEARQAALRGEIEKAASRLRELPFKRPVSYNVLSRSEIKAVILQKISEQYSDAEFEHLRLGYVALGLIPDDYQLKQGYLDLLGEQVAAFYDQHTHRLFMFEDASLDASQSRVILAHELVHALQDQHFSLKNLPLEIKNNDDRALAASALVEGDATLVMNAYMMEDVSWKSVGESFAGVFTQSLQQLHAAPRILRESLLFPYVEGLKFCMALQMRHGDGFEAISAAFERLPASSSQILHPEKYFAGEQPVLIAWPETAVSGVRPLADNVLGELGTRVLLTDWVDAAAAKAAEGWRGDRYLVFKSDRGLSLVWRTVWAGPEEKERFVAAATRMWEKRYGAYAFPVSLHGSISKGGRPSMPAAPVIDFKAERTLKLVMLGENEVMLVDASDGPMAGALMAQFGK